MNTLLEYDHLLKFLVVGDSKVGKTSFLARFVENTFQEKTDEVNVLFFLFRCKLILKIVQSPKIQRTPFF